ncbi:MAG: protein kinase [Phycisphaerales bacterium]|nr:protein kinase [Phycisphaerales bacterium]
MAHRIGPYDILREIGRGGMGIVHLAIDTRLDRHVAIKALPEELASDRVRLERFEREARMLAQLNHPNIVGIHGVEEQEGQQYLILEFVEGETLADLLDTGPLPIDEATALAVQICAGVEAAHEAGVIHRDLKPGNIIITPDGQAKVLDFGLARTEEAPSSAGGADVSTVTRPRSPTIAGAILGTAAYMSPEQARGRRIDKRTDIWSFGVILYEMLTGASPFQGETATDSIGAVLHKEVNLDLLPAGTPPAIRRVVSRCVERDKSLRCRDIGDVRIELLRAKDESEAAPGIPTSGTPKAAFAIMVVAVIAAAAGWYLALNRPAAVPPLVRKFDVMVGTGEGPLKASCVRISPDGTRLAFIQDDVIHVRDFSSFESRPLPGTDGASSLFWSPDSMWIGYLASGDVNKVGLLGGGTVKVADVGSELHPGSRGGWTADNRLVFTAAQDIVAVSARGGSPSVLVDHDPEKEVDFHECSVITGTNVVLFIQHRIDGTFAVLASDGETRVVITEGEEQPLLEPSYSPSGHVMFIRGFRKSSLWAVGFDPGSMRVTSDPSLVLSDVSDASVSVDGTLAVYRGAVRMPGQLVWASSAGVERIGDPFEIVMQPLLSPDETRIALTTGELPKMDVWIHDIDRGSRSRITFHETFSTVRGWSPDGREVAVGVYDPTGDPKLATRFYAADGSGETRDMVEGIMTSLDAAWRSAIVLDGMDESDTVICSILLDDPTQKTELLDAEHMPGMAAIIDPTGTLVAHVSRESGPSELYCTRFPSGHGRWQVSTEGGGSPVWSADGKTLYFIDNNEGSVFAVDVTIEPSVRFSMPRLVLDAESLGLEIGNGYSVATDGRFLTTLADTDNEDLGAVSVIEHWYEEYRDKLSP